MKPTPDTEPRDDITTSFDEVTIEDVRRWQALAARTAYAGTRKICLNLIAEFYEQHPELAPPAAPPGDAA